MAKWPNRPLGDPFHRGFRILLSGHQPPSLAGHVEWKKQFRLGSHSTDETHVNPCRIPSIVWRRRRVQALHSKRKCSAVSFPHHTIHIIHVIRSINSLNCYLFRESNLEVSFFENRIPSFFMLHFSAYCSRLSFCLLPCIYVRANSSYEM